MKGNLASWGKITLFLIYLVVLAGSIVRMTGSGMGCPDWPKCFDSYIPPTSAQELPQDYQNIYSAKREKKIQRFATFLTSLGFSTQAKALVADKSLLQEQEFSVFNTWTEYINRLCGALAGFFILIQAVIKSIRYKESRSNALLSIGLLLLTLFQAWFGAMVVATNLVPWVLTVHMLLAVVMIIVQLHILHNQAVPENKRWKVSKLVVYTCIAGLLLMLIQTVWGTQIRQQIDELAKQLPRSSWIEHLDITYIYHRTLAIMIIVIGSILTYWNYKQKVHTKPIYALFAVILLEAIIGKMFSVLGMAAFLQPTHLLLSMVLFGLLYTVFLRSLRHKS